MCIDVIYCGSYDFKFIVFFCLSIRALYINLLYIFFLFECLFTYRVMKHFGIDEVLLLIAIVLFNEVYLSHC